MDEQIKQQKMYVEFLMYRDLLKQWTWPCELCEATDIQVSPKGHIINSHQEKISMIYNRCTDFYFEKFPKVKSAFLNQKCCISPQPIEYLLLADKERFCDWSSKEFLEQMPLSHQERTWIRKVIPFTAQVDIISPEELWKKRKLLFFKPLRGYGGKSVYRGKNITKKVFNRLLETPGIYQENVPPPLFQDPQGIEWKYDIRAYVYKDQIQQLIARLYQGQLTNVQVPYSGFAAVHLS